MGIGGHMLGSTKLARLQRVSGLPLDRAYRRNHECEGRVVLNGRCYHFTINWATGRHAYIPKVIHWASCPERKP